MPSVIFCRKFYLQNVSASFVCNLYPQSVSAFFTKASAHEFLGRALHDKTLQFEYFLFLHKVA